MRVQHNSGISTFYLEKLSDQTEAANRSFKTEITGVSELPKEHTELQQCSGEQRRTEHWVCLAARHCQVCPQCRILYMSMILNESENGTSQCLLVIVTLSCVAG